MALEAPCCLPRCCFGRGSHERFRLRPLARPPATTTAGPLPRPLEMCGGAWSWAGEPGWRRQRGPTADVLQGGHCPAPSAAAPGQEGPGNAALSPAPPLPALPFPVRGQLRPLPGRVLWHPAQPRGIPASRCPATRKAGEAEREPPSSSLIREERGLKPQHRPCRAHAAAAVTPLQRGRWGRRPAARVRPQLEESDREAGGRSDTL